MDQFWRTAHFRHDTSPRSIRATVLGQEVIITEQNIRRVLGFNDAPDQRIEFGQELIYGCFRRMGYRRVLNQKKFNKINLPPIYRFLVHTYVSCLSNRKGGHDAGNLQVLSGCVALLLNKPYNFTRYIFNSMLGNIANGDQRFIQFPRFIQLLINDQHPNLQADGEIYEVSSIVKRVFKDCQNYHDKGVVPAAPLFGRLIHENYQEPENDGWTDDDYVSPVNEPNPVQQQQQQPDELPEDQQAQQQQQQPDQPAQQQASPVLHQILQLISWKISTLRMRRLLDPCR